MDFTLVFSLFLIVFALVFHFFLRSTNLIIMFINLTFKANEAMPSLTLCNAHVDAAAVARLLYVVVYVTRQS